MSLIISDVNWSVSYSSGLSNSSRDGAKNINQQFQKHSNELLPALQIRLVEEINMTGIPERFFILVGQNGGILKAYLSIPSYIKQKSRGGYFDFLTFSSFAEQFFLKVSPQQFAYSFSLLKLGLFLHNYRSMCCSWINFDKVFIIQLASYST